MVTHEPTQQQIQHACDVQEKYNDRLMQYPHVVGTGVGFAKKHGQATPEVALIVMVDRKLEPDTLEPNEMLPHSLDGVRVDVQEMGAFAAY
jgi:hypothetical protein